MVIASPANRLTHVITGQSTHKYSFILNDVKGSQKAQASYYLKVCIVYHCLIFKDILCMFKLHQGDVHMPIIINTVETYMQFVSNEIHELR